MNDNNAPFKIIGLRVYEQCDEHLRKVLKPNITYFFCNDYEDDDDGGIRKKANCQELSPTFFSIHDKDQGPLVNISCVVGHNGAGKSSLIELMIRIINNFACLSGFRSDNPNLKYAHGVYADLFFLANNDICSICCSDQLMDFKYRDEGMMFYYNSDYFPFIECNKKRRKLLPIAKFLFHTIVSNYSLYAYNESDVQSEEVTIYDNDDFWLTPLFSIIDAYQTPIVLSPHRKNGIIDVNTEYSLSAQKLGELFLNCRDGKYVISDTEKVEGFVYRLEPESKLLSRTIKKHLLSQSKIEDNDLPFDTNYHEKNQKLVYNDELLLDEHIIFWGNFDERFFDSFLLDAARQLIKESRISDEEPLIKKTDFYLYLSNIKSKIDPDNEYYSNATLNLIKIREQEAETLTIAQFQGLFLVYEIYKCWANELHIDINSNVSVFLSSNDSKDCALKYLIYKTIKIFENHPDYFSEDFRDYWQYDCFFNNTIRSHKIYTWFNLLLKDIKRSKSYITLKIRQTLHYWKHSEDLPLLKNKRKAPDIAKSLFLSNRYKYYLDCADYYDSIKDVENIADAIPPPIFEIDYLISQNGQSMYPLSRMSSGERQLLNSSSSIVYHLKNIAHSYSLGTKLAYENVNVVLEEVELYFHPEYQRRFVKYLLEQIENAHLPAKMSINLMFVTHSPFILSDIPRQNVLFLKNGIPDRSMQEDTFGANIHTLLQNGFFLNSVPIGAFAKEKISQMFALLNQSRDISEDSLNRLEKEIPLVSEPLLRSQLMRLFTMRKKFKYGDFQETIVELEKRIKSLEERLDDKN